MNDGRECTKSDSKPASKNLPTEGSVMIQRLAPRILGLTDLTSAAEGMRAASSHEADMAHIRL